LELFGIGIGLDQEIEFGGCGQDVVLIDLLIVFFFLLKTPKYLLKHSQRLNILV